MQCCLKELKQEQGCCVLSYFTQAGKILVRISEDKDTYPIEIPVGANKEVIRNLCQGKKVELSAVDIRDHFRSIHETVKARQQAKHDDGWTKVSNKRGQKPNANRSSTTKPTSGQPATALPAAHQEQAPQAMGNTTLTPDNMARASTTIDNQVEQVGTGPDQNTADTNSAVSTAE